jgi:hypothetical protein
VYLGDLDASDQIGVNIAHDVKRHHVEILTSAVRGDDLTPFIPSDDHEIWNAWLGLFHRPWWSCVLVIQEAVSNQSVSVFCEEDLFDWDILPFSFLLLNQSGGEIPCIVLPSPIAFRQGMPTVMRRMHVWKSIMDDHRNPNSAVGRIPLGSTLDMMRAFSSSNPRDKIYAILGLSKSCAQRTTSGLCVTR